MAADTGGVARALLTPLSERVSAGGEAGISVDALGTVMQDASASAAPKCMGGGGCSSGDGESMTTVAPPPLTFDVAVVGPDPNDLASD